MEGAAVNGLGLRGTMLGFVKVVRNEVEAVMSITERMR